jgi:hypothetical protein
VDEDDKGEIGEPALLPISQFVCDDDGYWTSNWRVDAEPDGIIVLLGDVDCFW